MHYWYTHIYAYLDNILLTDPTEKMHLATLQNCKNDLKKYALRLKNEVYLFSRIG